MTRSFLIAAAVAASLALPALAQDAAKPDVKPPQPAPAPAPAAEEVDPAAAMMELATPGAEHELLKQFEGTWKARTRAWFAPGEPEESTGTMVNTLVLDGRFLRHEFSSEMMGMPFSGLGYWGYDKARKEWVGSWMDTWSTGIMASGRGTYDPQTRTWTMTATYFSPETMQEEKQREVIKVLDPDTHIMQMFMVGPDGAETKALEILYTRAPAAAPAAKPAAKPAASAGN